MNESLSRLVDGLLEQAKRGEDLSSGISRVRAAIKKVIEGEDTIFGRFHALIESFREVLPEEKQRYLAAIKVLSATFKLSRQEIVVVVNHQILELKILEKHLVSALPRGPEESATEARSQELRNEISKLREEIAQLEKKEKEIANCTAGQGKETVVVEKALREVFADIRAEITTVKKKVEELHAENTGQHPVPDTETKTVLAGERQSTGQQSITDQLSSLNDTVPQKICPMCGAQMNFSTTRNRWQCFACSHEELERDEVRGAIRTPVVNTIFPEATAASEPKKQCRLCGGRMDYYIAEKKWLCFSCAAEESEKDEVQSNNREVSKDSIFPEPAAVPELKQGGEKNGQRAKASEPAPASEQKQKCSMCGGRMNYYAAESKLQCHSCGFEYFKKKDEGRGKTDPRPANIEEAADKDKSNALMAISPSESLFDLSSASKSSPGYWGAKKKESGPAKKRPAIGKKCPACGATMQSIGSGKGWQCRYCGYERRI